MLVILVGIPPLEILGKLSPHYPGGVKALVVAVPLSGLFEVWHGYEIAQEKKKMLNKIIQRKDTTDYGLGRTGKMTFPKWSDEPGGC